MISLDDAVKKAADFAKNNLGPDRTTGLQLEETENVERGAGRAWVITLSMLVAPPDSSNPVKTLLGGPPQPSLLEPIGTRRPDVREFKTFTLDGETGEVLSMKIREFAGIG